MTAAEAHTAAMEQAADFTPLPHMDAAPEPVRYIELSMMDSSIEYRAAA